MALTAVDRSIVQRCLQHESGAWNDFVDRFLGLFYHAIHYTAHLRSHPIKAEAVEDLAQEILKEIAAGDYALLRGFRGKCSLATYLVVLARRICVREFSKRASSRKALPVEFQTKPAATKSKPALELPPPLPDPDPEPERDSEIDSELEELAPKPRAGMEGLDLLQKLIRKLPGREREVVRLFYFEGRKYEEISIELDLPIPSIAPILKRARKLLRKYEDEKV